MGSYNPAMPRSVASSVSAGPSVAGPAPSPRAATLADRIGVQIRREGGWLRFDRFMALALYEPGLGYYARPAQAGRPDGPLGRMPGDGSDFATAPEISPLFARALARQVREGFEATGQRVVTEFGAGTGRLAAQLLDELEAGGAPPVGYRIVEVSGALRARQREQLGERLRERAGRVQWLDAWPERVEGVVIGNEVLDAMPVRLLHFDGRRWLERGVRLRADDAPAAPGAADAGDGVLRLSWDDRPADELPDFAAEALEPDATPVVPGTTVEWGEQAIGFVRSLADRAGRTLVLFIDYGFPAAELRHPQRLGGTLMCHRAHRADANPLVDVGDKDITAHVDFTAVALAAQEGGLEVLGYTSQARFLLNCGVADDLASADVRGRTDGLRLVHEHEMGELFKVIALGRGCRFTSDAGPIGFVHGDRTHRL
jgi:SAM-dependent MidA family methyltransferase